MRRIQSGWLKLVLGGLFGVVVAAHGALPAAAADQKTVVLILTQKAGDHGPIDGLIDGLAQAKAKFGVATRVVQALDPASYETTIRTLASRHTDVIITTFFAMTPIVAKVAAEFPKTNFALIVGAPIDPPLPNVRVTGYATEENAYLAGLFAGNLSTTKALAYEAGAPLPTTDKEFAAFTKAAQSVDPAITTSMAFVQSFEDPVKGREIAATYYSQGVDPLLSMAAGSDVGSVQAALEANKTIIVASPPLVDQAPRNVGFVISFEWAQTMLTEVENALSPDHKSGFRIGGVASNEIVASIPDSYVAASGAERKARIERARAAIAAAVDDIKRGKLVVLDAIK